MCHYFFIGGRKERIKFDISTRIIDLLSIFMFFDVSSIFQFNGVFFLDVIMNIHDGEIISKANMEYFLPRRFSAF